MALPTSKSAAASPQETDFSGALDSLAALRHQWRQVSSETKATDHIAYFLAINQALGIDYALNATDEHYHKGIIAFLNWMECPLQALGGQLQVKASPVNVIDLSSDNSDDGGSGEIDLRDEKDTEYDVAYHALMDFLDPFFGQEGLEACQVRGSTIMRWFTQCGDSYYRLPESMQDAMLAVGVIATASGWSTVASRILIGQLAWVRCQTPYETSWSEIRASAGINSERHVLDGDEILW